MIQLYRKLRMNLKAALIASLILLSFQLYSQHGWSYDFHAFEGNCDIRDAIVFLDGVQVDTGSLGAFVGDDCRGFDDTLSTDFPEIRHFSFFAYSNVGSGEIIGFKYYDPFTGVAYDVIETITFVPDAQFGSLINPYVFNVVTNEAPLVDFPIEDQLLNQHFGSVTVELGAVFSDPNNDLLTLSVVSSNTDIVTVSLSGDVLTISEVGLGQSIITVTGTDGLLSVDNTFTVSVGDVNDIPQVVNPVSDKEFLEHFTSTNIDVSEVFIDEDAVTLFLSAVSSDTDVVTVSISEMILTISEVGLGTSMITLTASDGFLSADDQFDVVVNNVNDPPIVLNPLSDNAVNEQFGSMMIELDGVFEDPDGDLLTLGAISSNTDVVEVSILGNVLTILEVAKGFANIIVTASDGTWESVDQFVLTINDVNFAPEVKIALSDKDLLEHFGSTRVDLVPVFNDPDGDLLLLSAVSSDITVITVEVVKDTLVIHEVGLGDAIITINASDGEWYVDESFAVSIANVNDAPIIINSIGDQVLAEGFDSLYFDLKTVFADPDMDELSFTASVVDASIVELILRDTLLIIKGSLQGNTELSVTASDGEFMATDAFNIEVSEEVLFIIYYEEEVINDGDTILRCNNAGEFYLYVRSGEEWSYYSESGWTVFEVVNDTSLYIAYSENFSGEDRITDFMMEDIQGHKMKFIIKQIENCKPDAIWEEFGESFDVYPNPVREILTIDISEFRADRIIVELMNTHGKRFLLDRHDTFSNEKIDVDLTHLMDGVYYIRVSDGSHAYLKKVVKQ